jgi:hypothetical protein
VEKSFFIAPAPLKEVSIRAAAGALTGQPNYYCPLQTIKEGTLELGFLQVSFKLIRQLWKLSDDVIMTHRLVGGFPHMLLRVQFWSSDGK